MKHTLALSMIPVVLAWAGMPKPVPPSKGYFPVAEIEPKNTLPENITARRIDEGTFALRWAQVAEMPPTIEVRHRSGVVANSVGTVALTPPAPPPSRHLSEGAETVGATVSARPRQVKRVALQTNVCTRHGMRKVNYGRKWRCRR